MVTYVIPVIGLSEVMEARLIADTSIILACIGVVNLKDGSA